MVADTVPRHKPEPLSLEVTSKPRSQVTSMHRPQSSKPSSRTDRPGTLYVVATPIGNGEDITLRAIKTLSAADLIASEDTRCTGSMLSRHRIKNRLISYHDHNAARRTPELIGKLAAGESVALVSDAGTPSVSDPGYRLIRAALAENIPVVPIPGVSALVTALSVSGLPTDTFVFIGFCEKKEGRRRKQLQTLSQEPRTLVFYESPKRIIPLMEDILSIMGDRQAVLAREMTKSHEEFLRDKLSGIVAVLKGRATVKGECTLLVQSGKPNRNNALASALAELRGAIADMEQPLSDIARTIAHKYGIPKRHIYDEALKIKQERQRQK